MYLSADMLRLTDFNVSLLVVIRGLCASGRSLPGADPIVHFLLHLGAREGVVRDGMIAREDGHATGEVASPVTVTAEAASQTIEERVVAVWVGIGRAAELIQETNVY